jgi:hypothetical protein
MSCDVHQFSDTMVCACGLRWDVNDPDPPKCPLEIPEVGEDWFRRAVLRHPSAPITDYREAVDAARARGIAVQELSDRQVSEAQRRLSRLYSEPGEHVWAILDQGSKWFVIVIVVIAAFVSGWRYGPSFSWLFE